VGAAYWHGLARDTRALTPKERARRAAEREADLNRFGPTENAEVAHYRRMLEPVPDAVLVDAPAWLAVDFATEADITGIEWVAAALDALRRHEPLPGPYRTAGEAIAALAPDPMDQSEGDEDDAEDDWDEGGSDDVFEVHGDGYRLEVIGETTEGLFVVQDDEDDEDDEDDSIAAGLRVIYVAAMRADPRDVTIAVLLAIRGETRQSSDHLIGRLQEALKHGS
jgi:hypothetical protein